MHALRKLQLDCERAFADGDADPLLPALVDNEIPAAVRVKVYQNNARETYRKALSSTYPVVERLVGDACFRSLAGMYAHLHPSRNADLQHFGRAFADLLDEEYERSEFAYLGDVARLELAIEDALLEPEAETLDLEALAGVPPGDLLDVTFTLAPSLRLVASTYPVLSIWRSNQPGHEQRVDLSQGAEHVVVRRTGDEAEMRLIDRAAFELAAALTGGATLQAAWVKLPDAARENLGDALQSLVANGSLSGFCLPAR